MVGSAEIRSRAIQHVDGAAMIESAIQYMIEGLFFLFETVAGAILIGSIVFGAYCLSYWIGG